MGFRYVGERLYKQNWLGEQRSHSRAHGTVVLVLVMPVVAMVDVTKHG